MIEINLSPTKKEASLTNIAGIDLSLINVKMLVVALLILYIPESFIASYFEGVTAEETKVQIQLRTELRKYKSQVKKKETIKKQVDALIEQEEKLAKKLSVVKKVINKRQNPYKVLKYIADNIPEGVWLVSLELQDRELTMKGYSRNFKNIGAFLENLKNSIFFQKNINYDRPKELEDVVDGVRLEIFEIKANVASFE